MTQIMKHFLPSLLCLFVLNLFSQDDFSDLYKTSNQQFKIGKYDDALITNIKALKLAEKSNNCDQIAYANLQVGKMQYYNKERRQALHYFFKAKALADSCKIDSIQEIVYHNIGAMYVELRVEDSALIFLNKTIKLIENTNKYSKLSMVNAVIADLHLNNTYNLEEAEKYILESERYAKLSQNKTSIAFATIKRGILFQKFKNYNQALVAFNSGLQLYNEVGFIEGKLYAMRLILDIKIFLNSNDLQVYLSRYEDIKDSVYRAEGANKIAEYKTIYQTEKQEQENKLLVQENSLKHAQVKTRNRTIIILAFAIVLIFVFVGWQVNVNNLKKKQKELELAKKLQQEKERISRDLHDNVGGQLSYILYSLDDITSDDKQKREELSKNINESVRTVIANLRETIWAINDENITVSNVSDKLKMYTRQMFKNTNTKVVFNENITNDILLSSLVGLNLFRICQEIINNAFKYAEATELKITIKSDAKIEINITDNGKGFDMNSLMLGTYGLKNIKDRSEESNIKMQYNSSINNGTQFMLIV